MANKHKPIVKFAVKENQPTAKRRFNKLSAVGYLWGFSFSKILFYSFNLHIKYSLNGFLFDLILFVGGSIVMGIIFSERERSFKNGNS